MRKLVLAAVLLLGTALLAGAQEEPAFQPSFSLEVSTGIPPLHMNFSPSRSRKEELADLGQEAISTDAFYPVINLTGVYRPWIRTEFTFSAGASWCHHQIKQHAAFGTDPNGKPRYNLKDGEMAGWTDSTPMISATLQWRHLWTPRSAVTLYSGAGIGLVFGANACTPAPALIPIGLRFTGKHLYLFAECPLSPLATLLHGGLGWRF